MRREIKDIIKNSFYLYITQGLNYLLPMVTLPFLLVTLSTTSFGIYSFAFAFSQFVILFVDFGFNLTATKKIAENADQGDEVKKIFWRIMVIKFTFFVIAGMITVFLTFTVTKLFEYREGIWISLLTVLGTVIFPIWWFQGMNKMKLLSIINGGSKLLTYPLIFIFVTTKTDVNLAIFLQSLSMFLAGVISFVYLFKNHKHYFNGKLFSINRIVYISEIRSSWPIFLSNSSISLYTNSLTLLLGFFATPYSVGLFGAMERIVRVICFGVLGPINQACFPLLARLKQTDFNKARKIFQMTLLSITVLMIIAFIAFYVLQDLVTKYLFKGFTVDDQHLLILFMAMIFPIAWGGVCGQLGLLALGNERHKRAFSKTYIFVGLLSIPISVTSIYFFEIRGAVYSMMTVEITIFLILFYLVRKYKFI